MTNEEMKAAIIELIRKLEDQSMLHRIWRLLQRALK